MKLAEYAKAATAVLVVAYSTYQAARLGSSPGGEAVTVDEWIGVAVTGLVAGFAVWLVPNAPAGKTGANEGGTE